MASGLAKTRNASRPGATQTTSSSVSALSPAPPQLPLGAERLVRARADPSIFDRRTANVTVGGRLSNWRAAMHHFVAYAMGAAGQNWGDQDSPPIQRP